MSAFAQNLCFHSDILLRALICTLWIPIISFDVRLQVKWLGFTLGCLLCYQICDSSNCICQQRVLGVAFTRSPLPTGVNNLYRSMSHKESYWFYHVIWCVQCFKCIFCHQWKSGRLSSISTSVKCILIKGQIYGPQILNNC